MKVKIKHFNGELPNYLTEGKVYKAARINEHLFGFKGDDGRNMFATFYRSSHLNEGSWEVISE